MFLPEKVFYVIKQSDYTTWNFTYDKNRGVLYRILKEEKESNYKELEKESSGNFSVLLLPNDDIYFLYEDLKENIKLRILNENKWSEDIVILKKATEIYDISFKAILNKNQIYLFYNVLNKETKIRTLFNQVVDENFNLASPRIIAKSSDENNCSFNIVADDNNKLLIMYQKSQNNYKLGYKILNTEFDTWSDFHIIDESSKPFIDYSFLSINDAIHSLYIKKEKNKDVLIYSQSEAIKEGNNRLFEGTDIKSCSFFAIEGHLYCSWINNNEIYNCFTKDKGKTFSAPSSIELLTSLNVIKSIYKSNLTRTIRDLIINEMYVMDDDEVEVLIIPNEYNTLDSSIINKIKSHKECDQCLIEAKSYLNVAYNKMLIYEKQLRQKEDLITLLKNSIQEYVIRIQIYENKLKDINTEYIKFQEDKNLLNGNINYLQESLKSKERKINELENASIEQGKEILIFKEQFDEKQKQIMILQGKTSEQEKVNMEKESKILSFNEEVEILRNQLEDLNLNLAITSPKIKESFLKRIFNNRY
ncbi:hypothetical protein G9F72_008635 [Clostridium estertheticum]|uniref:hypothetical protein n=1 Tax=Clostridium estertheticum TaxID=238834 RepID=UPI0013E99755|nr:hypothetical protein [Clostridium estertheticum]MBN4049315.1 hypothetical protein [bacterium AH-315-N14]MBZ9686394.1 hypothetical protein [Clostridium estertheticum]